MQRQTLILLGLLILVIGGVLWYRTSGTTKTQTETQNTVTQPPQTQDVVYTGDLPCADCEGIDVVLTLRQDGTFTQSSTYRGRDVAPLQETGTWMTIKGDATDQNATVYELSFNGEGTVKQYYLVSGNELKQLDESKNLIDAPFNTSLIRKS